MSGGFAIVQPNSQLSINAVEGFPLDQFSADAVRSQISEAQKIAGGGGSEQDIAEAKIELEARQNPVRKWIKINYLLGVGKLTGSAEVGYCSQYLCLIHRIPVTIENVSTVCFN